MAASASSHGSESSTATLSPLDNEPPLRWLRRFRLAPQDRLLIDRCDGLADIAVGSLAVTEERRKRIDE